MDKKKIKRIIAREGLIIVGIASFSLIVYLLAIWFSSIEFKSTYELKFRNGETHKVDLATSVKEQKNDSAIPSDQEWSEIAKEAFETTPDNILEKKLISNNLPLGLFPFINKITPAMETVGILFFFIAYPLYLLIRFIIWAIRTLRGK